ncbi:hypothetical protein [Pseudolactococcus reticulitermitis]|uniref:Uncharacterized protein n=1 Tax=Pseudolactococcus reticulitermitis TaxID=2025039 RepID=A0A224XAL5_9LACT|nr:hypothetical protein [Lactococcus reticulitermitis]GAX46765.1 hypothetical protein RsY01_344 [Lactococcus reticulitermitis]
MYPLAVQQGVSAKDYWGLTYDELVVQLKANQSAKGEEFQVDATMNYSLAKLIAFAFHDPQKMPAFSEVYALDTEDDTKQLEAPTDSKITQDEVNFMAYFNAINTTMKRKEETEHDNQN